MNGRWSDNRTMQFIQEYRSQKCLWQKAANVKTKNARDTSYRTVKV